MVKCYSCGLVSGHLDWCRKRPRESEVTSKCYSCGVVSGHLDSCIKRPPTLGECIVCRGEFGRHAFGCTLDALVQCRLCRMVYERNRRGACPRCGELTPRW
jgi:hypothetical protein